MTPPRQTLNGASAPRPTDPGEGFDETASAVLATSQQGAAAGDGEHRGSHTVTAAAKMAGDRTPPAMGTTTMSLTDRNLRTSNDELPQVRSRRRWVLPAAGAVLLLAGCTVAGVSLLGDKDAPAPTPPPASAGPSAQEIQAAKDAAWKSVQAYNERTLQAERVNSLDGIDLASVALPTAIQAEQQWIDNALALGQRTEGTSRAELISSEFSAAAPDAFAPARVQIATCNDTSDIRILDQAGNNMRVAPDGSANYATRLIVHFWVYDEDGAWKTDSGQRTDTPC
jgi:hypothetical protein